MSNPELVWPMAMSAITGLAWGHSLTRPSLFGILVSMALLAVTIEYLN